MSEPEGDGENRVLDAGEMLLETANPHAHVTILVIILWKALFSPLGQTQTLNTGTCNL